MGDSDISLHVQSTTQANSLTIVESNRHAIVTARLAGIELDAALAFRAESSARARAASRASTEAVDAASAAAAARDVLPEVAAIPLNIAQAVREANAASVAATARALAAANELAAATADVARCYELKTAADHDALRQAFALREDVSFQASVESYVQTVGRYVPVDQANLEYLSRLSVGAVAAPQPPAPRPPFGGGYEGAVLGAFTASFQRTAATLGVPRPLPLPINPLAPPVMPA